MFSKLYSYEMFYLRSSIAGVIPGYAGDTPAIDSQAVGLATVSPMANGAVAPVGLPPLLAPLYASGSDGLRHQQPDMATATPLPVIRQLPRIRYIKWFAVTLLTSALPLATVVATRRSSADNQRQAAMRQRALPLIAQPAANTLVTPDTVYKMYGVTQQQSCVQRQLLQLYQPLYMKLQSYSSFIVLVRY